MQCHVSYVALYILAPNFPVISNIRGTLVKMFAGPVSVQNSDSGDYSTTDQHFDTVIAANGELPVDPSTCVFWCAVALGSLMKGRPIKSVRNGAHNSILLCIVSPAQYHRDQTYSSVNSFPW